MSHSIVFGQQWKSIMEDQSVQYQINNSLSVSQDHQVRARNAQYGWLLIQITVTFNLQNGPAPFVLTDSAIESAVMK